MGSLLVAHSKEGELCSPLAAGTADLPPDWQRAALVTGTTGEEQNPLWLLLSQRPKAVNTDLPVMSREGGVLYI